MKPLATVLILMLMLGNAGPALQNTNNPNTEKDQSAAGQTPHNIGNPPPVDRPGLVRSVTSDLGPSQAKAESQSKLLLDLGSMPCFPDDQQCRAKEKKRLEAQEERP
jgi:hypothetical protein